MTFDARSGSSNSGNRSNLLFGAAVLLAVGGGFFLTLAMPLPGKTGAPLERPVIIASADSAAASLPTSFEHTRASKAYFKALRTAAPEAHETLVSEVSSMRSRTPRKQFEVISQHAADVLEAHASDLARANTSHIDRLLDMTRDKLRAASRSNSEWCSGAKYVALSTDDPRQAFRVAQDIVALEGAVQDYSYAALTILMEAIEDARENPVTHGPVTPRDNAALQGVMMSMMSDPQIMPLMLASQSGGRPEDALAGLNVCELASTAVIAVKTLPQGTKGRVWSKTIADAELGGANFNLLN